MIHAPSDALRLIRRAVLVFVFTLCLALALPALALNTATWSGASPAAGAVVLIKPTAPVVIADDTAPITKATVTMNGYPASFVNVDFYVGHSYYDEEAESDVWMVDDWTVARITGYFSPSQIVAGTNTIVTTVTSSKGVSTYTRTFTYGSVTTISVVTPAADSVLPASPSDITVTLSSGATSFSSVMSLDGVVVPTTYTAATKTFKHTPAALSAGQHTVAFTAIDSSGGSVSRTWKFKVSPPMSDASECSACHAGYPASHPVADCADCHTHGYVNQGGTHGNETPTAAGCSGDGGGQQDDACHRLDHSNDPQWGVWGSGPFDCADCHSATYPDVPQHTDAETASAHVSASTGCEPCHSASLVTEHAKFPKTATIKYQCTLCHGAAASAQVKAAVAAGNTACSSCHTGTHEDLDGVHQATLADANMIISGDDYGTHSCSECHQSNILTAIHGGTNADCVKCHPSPKSTLTPSWDKSCAQGGCHTGSTATMHTAIDSAHAIPAVRADCMASGCHDAGAMTPFAGKSVALIHSAATTTAGGETRTSCEVCHKSGAALTADCATSGCHADRTLAHGYDPARHVSSASCIESCHAPLAGMTELKPIHDAATTPVTCAGCHATKVDEIAPWDKTCTACHPIADLHASAAADHVGTDVAYQAASFFGNGCTGDAEHTTQLACHTITNIAAVHSTMVGNGCAVCHGDGKTPTQECYTCHKPGYANTYTVPGTPSANIVTTQNPSTDNFITAGWTYTTTPASQPIYSVVNTPWTSGTPARFVTITSNTAGAILVGHNGVSLPSNARIVAVEVYSRGKATTASPLRKMQGVFKIGGQTYLSSGTGTNLTTAWTATTGGARYSSPSTRIDYTREPLYGEMIWRNPATGQDWTVSELNGTDPDSSLEAYGVNLTASATANSISLAQVYVKVTYYTVGESVTNPTVGTHTYHGDNVKYLHDRSDAPAGQRFVSTAPAHGWYDALYFQDCYDFCHRGNGGQPTFSANQGQWMWYSVGGDPYDAVAATRTLALKAITLPADSPTLAFSTNYQLGTGASGTVEVSTDGGTNWVPLTGTVGGTSKSSLTGNASGWVPASYDLSAYAGQSVKLRFKYVNGSSGSAGWAFDSLTVASGSGTVYSDDAEKLKPDWTNTFWTRSMGAFPLQ